MQVTNELDFRAIDRLPPQNIEAEEVILGGIMLDPSAIIRVEGKLKPEMFYISSHKHIFSALEALHRDNKPTDLLSVTNYLTDFDMLTTIGGRTKLASLLETTVSAVNIDALADIVIEKYRRRQLIKVASEIYQLAYDTESEINHLLDCAETKLLSIRTEAITQETEPVILAEPLIHVFDNIEKISQGIVKPGISTGFYDLDLIIKGFQPGKLITLAGRPAMGKSSMLGNMAINAARNSSQPVILFSTEMTKEEWAMRYLSQEARVEGIYLESGRISNDQWKDLAIAVEKLSQDKIYIDDSPKLTVASLRSKVKRMVAKHGKVSMVGIDYLQLMADIGGDDGSGKSARQIGEITRQLKLLARECNTTVVLLSQLNRGVESRNNKRPLMSDLRESGRIEEDSDLVIMLYREEYYVLDTPDRGLAEVIITKHRGGPTGIVKLLFESQFTQFKNLKRTSY